MALVVLWEAISRVRGVPTWLLPSPTDIGMATVQWAGTSAPAHAGDDLRNAGGLRLSIVAGVFLALVVTISPFAMRTIYPLLLGLQSLPKVAIAPLLLMWVGFRPGLQDHRRFSGLLFPDRRLDGFGTELAAAPAHRLARSFATPLWRIYLKIRIPSPCRTFSLASRSRSRSRSRAP